MYNPRNKINYNIFFIENKTLYFLHNKKFIFINDKKINIYNCKRAICFCSLVNSLSSNIKGTFINFS